MGDSFKHIEIKEDLLLSKQPFMVIDYDSGVYLGIPMRKKQTVVRLYFQFTGL